MTRHYSKRKPWRDWEVKILQNYPVLEVEVLEAEFGRNKRSIQNKLKKLKIRKRRVWTAREIQIARDYTESRDMNALAILLGPTFDRNSARSLERYAKETAKKAQK